MAETGVTMVFVVDDDPQVRASIKGLLKSAGLRSESFETAEQFLERRRPEGPSCLIADVSLPGISGLDFQQQLKKGGLQIPIVFITAHGDYSMTVKAIKSGAVEFLTKPFEDYDLWQSGLCALPCDPLFFHRTFPRADHVQFASSCVRSLGICFLSAFNPHMVWTVGQVLDFAVLNIRGYRRKHELPLVRVGRMI